MPTYQYACVACQARVEVVQRFTDEPLTECAECGGRLRKVFAPVGIVFKGSGFYRTDSRANGDTRASGNGKRASAGDSGESSGSGESASRPTGSGADSAPAGDGKTGNSSPTKSAEKVA